MVTAKKMSGTLCALKTQCWRDHCSMGGQSKRKEASSCDLRDGWNLPERHRRAFSAQRTVWGKAVKRGQQLWAPGVGLDQSEGYESGNRAQCRATARPLSSIQYWPMSLSLVIRWPQSCHEMINLVALRGLSGKGGNRRHKEHPRWQPPCLESEVKPGLGWPLDREEGMILERS